MISNINWNLVPYFKSSEFDDPLFPGSGKNINGSLLIQLVKLRQSTFRMNPQKGWPMIIHSSVGGAVDMEGRHGHTENSLHLFENFCQAVDFHFKTDAPIREQFLVISCIGFGGIGIYYDWNNIGFHVDIRPKSKVQRWKVQDGIYTYLLR